jgi:hypothetical protein
LWKFLSMNRKLGVLSSEGWEKKTWSIMTIIVEKNAIPSSFRKTGR